MNLALIDPRTWLQLAFVVLVAVGAWFGYDWAYNRGAASVQAKWDAERAEVAQQSLKLQQEAQATTARLQADKNALRRDKDAQIATLSSSLADALGRLHERPSRDSAGDVPRDPGTGAALGSTGANLLRQDAEFLVREAARADRLRLDLAECQAAYGRAQSALKK